MKILLSSYFKFPAVSGVWHYMLQLKKGLEKKGHETDIFVQQPKTNNYYLFETEQILEHSHLKQKIGNILSNSLEDKYSGYDSWIIQHEKNRYYYELAASFFNLKKYDVIHTQDVVSSLAISRVKPKHVLHVATVHAPLHHDWVRLGLTDNPQAYKYSLYQEYYGATVSHRTIVPSAIFKNYLHREFNVPLEQLTVVHNGFDVEHLLERLNQYKDQSPSEKLILGCVARLSKEKGHLCLLQALRRLKDVFDRWECWLIGDGSLRKDLEEECRKLNLAEHVVFWGEQDDITPFLSKIDVFVLASQFESLSYATMEAQIAGKAVVVTSAGGICEVVEHEKTGLVSPVGHSEELFLNLKTVLENERLRKKLGENARRRAIDQWSLNRMTDRILQVYQAGLEEIGNLKR